MRTSTTGSPLPINAYHWGYASVKRDLWLASISGGTDIASGFVACAPSLPVTAGELQCRELCVAAYAFSDAGQSVTDEVGELVITKPMPSMPVRFWNDAGDKRYLESYFETFVGVWRHGDWERYLESYFETFAGVWRHGDWDPHHAPRHGGDLWALGQHDQPLWHPHGHGGGLPRGRGAARGARQPCRRPQVSRATVVHAAVRRPRPGSPARRRAEGTRIAQQIRTKASARHVPNEVYQVDEIPRALTGKTMEVPVRKLSLGAERDNVASPDAMVNPASLDFFVRLASQLNPKEQSAA